MHLLQYPRNEQTLRGHNSWSWTVASAPLKGQHQNQWCHQFLSTTNHHVTQRTLEQRGIIWLSWWIMTDRLSAPELIKLRDFGSNLGLIDGLNLITQWVEVLQSSHLGDWLMKCIHHSYYVQMNQVCTSHLFIPTMALCMVLFHISSRDKLL